MIHLVQLDDRLWSVGGQSIEVPGDAVAATFLIDLLDADSDDLGDRMLEVHATGQAPFTVTLTAGGAVTTAALTDPRILPWLRAPRATPATPVVDQLAVKQGWNLFGVHHGSGATTWAQLLEATEISNPAQADGRVLLVARTTLHGVEATKPHMHRAGAVLMVADAPGRPPADVRRGMVVLRGAAPVVHVPWLAPLRGTLTVTTTPAVAKAAAKIAAAVRGSWKD